MLERLSAADVSVFLARECPRRSIASAQQLVTGLRALLRYLHLAGVIELPLRWAVPAVADRRGLSLPREGATFAVRGADPVLAASADVQMVDTVGAGDSFMAGLLSGLLDAGLLGGEGARVKLGQAAPGDCSRLCSGPSQRPA